MRTGKVLALLIVALASCDRTDLNVYRCWNPDKGHKDANGEPDPCHRNDPPAADAGPPNDAGEACPGLCLPGPQGGWVGPTLVWMGADEADAPLCPSSVPQESFTGHGAPIVPPVCPTCVCEPPSGSCELPATLTAASAICSGDGSGVTHTSFDPPANWTGTCTATKAIPAGKLCGGVPCVQSVTIAPLTMKQGACTPIETPHVPAPPTWGMFARGCTRARPLATPCTALDELCVPASPGPEFKQCVSLLYPNPDEVECSPDYPNRSVIYQDFVDQRTCAPCSCDAPDGSTCTGSISVFEDSTCKAPVFFDTLKLDATGAMNAPCVDVSPGAAIGSASASEPSYKPGKCTVIGGTLGKISFTFPRVICCQGTP